MQSPIYNNIIGDSISEVLTWFVTNGFTNINFIGDFKPRYVKAIPSFSPFPLFLSLSSLAFFLL
jgi:hypothetical protein